MCNNKGHIHAALMEAIKRSVEYRDSTCGYNIPEMFSLINRVRETYPDKMDKYLGTLRGAMKNNYNMARITRRSCAPFNYFRGD